MLALTQCSAPRIASTAEPVDHTRWDSLLRTYVDDDGLVDYESWLNDTIRLQAYLDLLRDPSVGINEAVAAGH